MQVHNGPHVSLGHTEVVWWLSEYVVSNFTYFTAWLVCNVQSLLGESLSLSAM